MEWGTDLDFEHSQVAAEMARRGTICDPSRPGNWLILSRASLHLGDFEGATDCLRAAVVAVPKSVELRIRLVESLIALDCWQEALPHAETALELAPGNPKATILRLDLLTTMRMHDRLDMDAVAAFAGKDTRLLKLHTNSIDPAAAVRFCDSLLAAKPSHAFARYLKAVALVKLGRIEDACAVMSMTGRIETVQLETPADYPDDEAFRRDLAREIRANPMLRRDPESKTTRGGVQTQVLRRPEAVAVEALVRQIKEAVDAYEARLQAAGDEFARARPKVARLNTWAVIYDGAGKQTPHMHPNGWITGVYYVSAPRGPGENAYRGPLVLGAEIPIKGYGAPPWATHEIEPVPGRLVMFPSYVPHATIPPGGADGERICVTFDVVHAAAA
jgi:uncharacterized protein (TIGR02466 family)